MSKARKPNLFGLLDDAERLIRPAKPRYISFEDLFDGRQGDLNDVVPIESVRDGDRQVLAARGRGHNEMPVIDLGKLADIPTVRSVFATTFVETERPLVRIEELLARADLVPPPETFANLPSLRRLHVGPVSARRRLAIDQLPERMTALALERHVLQDGTQQRADFSVFLRFRELQQLSLSQCWPKDSVAPLGELTSLIRLGCNAPAGWAAIKSCRELKHLRAVPRMANLRSLRTLTKLQTLELSGNGVDSLDGIEAFTALRRLKFVLMKVTSLHPLAGLPALEEVHLRGVQTVKDLSPLGRLPSLRKLTIEWHGGGLPDVVHVDSVRPLTHAGTLEELNLNGTVIDDGDLSPLAGLPSLRKLKVYGDIGPAVDKLRRARPDIAIEWNEAAKPTGERVGPVTIQPPVKGFDQWWISEDLTGLLATSTNYSAEAKLRAAVKKDDPELLARLKFDTEAENVVVLAKSEDDIRAVARLIGRLAAER